MKKRLAIAATILLLAAACRGRESADTAPLAPLPESVQALMVTYETVFQDGRTARFHVASDGTRVRLGNETESWRLFDTQNRTITFVDQVAGTAREVTFDDAIAERTKLLSVAPPEGTPTASIVEGPGEPERGHATHRIHVQVGSFSREIVLSSDILLPGEFFAMKAVTDSVDPRFAAILRDVMPVLVRQNGTLLSETNRLEVPEGEPVTVTTKLASVATIELSRSTFAVPDGITVTRKDSEAAPEE